MDIKNIAESVPVPVGDLTVEDPDFWDDVLNFEVCIVYAKDENLEEHRLRVSAVFICEDGDWVVLERQPILTFFEENKFLAYKIEKNEKGNILKAVTDYKQKILMMARYFNLLDQEGQI